MEITNLPGDEQTPKPRRATFEKLYEEMQHQLGPMRHLQEMQNVMDRHFPKISPHDYFSLSETDRRWREMVQYHVPEQIQKVLDKNSSLTAQIHRIQEQFFSMNKMHDSAEMIRRVAGLDSLNEISKRYEQFLMPLAEQQEWLNKLKPQAWNHLSAHHEFSQQLLRSPVFDAIASAQKSIDSLWGSFGDIDFSDALISESDTKDAAAAAQSIANVQDGELTLKDAVDQIIAVIKQQENPAVQLMLFLFMRKILDWIIGGAIGAAIAYYAPQMVDMCSQDATKAIKEVAHEVIGTPDLLVEYRYITAKVLIVRLNPRSLSPEVGRLVIGNVVKLVRKEKDFSLVLWTDRESGVEIQGWVFSRYLGKFH